MLYTRRTTNDRTVNHTGNIIDCKQMTVWQKCTMTLDEDKKKNLSNKQDITQLRSEYDITLDYKRYFLRKGILRADLKPSIAEKDRRERGR